MSVRVNFVLRPRVSSEKDWGCSRNSVRVTHPPVFRQRFKGLNASASTPTMRVELISQDRAQSRMHVGAGFEQGDVRAGSEQAILYQCRKSVPAPGHPCGLWRNSAGVGKNVAGFCPDCARIAQNLSRMAARPGRRARIQERRSRGLSSVKGTACSTRAKYSSSSFSACARVAIGAPQFTDAIASSTAMKARAILAAYWVEVIGVARLDELCD